MPIEIYGQAIFLIVSRDGENCHNLTFFFALDAYFSKQIDKANNVQYQKTKKAASNN